jgi:predicted small lipoprotein YifL
MRPFGALLLLLAVLAAGCGHMGPLVPPEEPGAPAGEAYEGAA